jgi:UDP-N-acetylglucosamine 2-epimerase
MKRIKICTIVGTRPEIIRLSAVIKLLDKTEGVEHILIHTGQNYDYELNQIFFEDLEIRKPDFFLEAATGNPIETIGNILIKIDSIFNEIMPEGILVLGDTNSCLCAIAAKRRKIPIFHMEAGNRCFDQRVPEETNRKIVDHISDINMPYSDIAREYLLREGILPDRIVKTGSPMMEVLNSYKDKIATSDVLEKHELVKGKYIVVSAHRDENINEKGVMNLISALNRLSVEFNLPIIVSTHPRTRNQLSKTSLTISEKIRFLKPLGFIDYNKLQVDSFLVLSDSGTISEESSILNFQALNIREAHERPEAMEEGSVMMVGFNIDRILQAITVLKNQKRGTERTLKLVEDYSVLNVSEKVVRIIISYVDYIQRTVWNKLG